MAATPVCLSKKHHEQRRLEGYSPQGRKESDGTEQLSNRLFCILFWIACLTL